MRDYRIQMLSAGDLLRQEVNKGTPLGLEAAGIMKEGGLLPDSTMRDLVHAEFDRSAHLPGLILDGYPRNVAQAQTLDEHLIAIGQPLSMIINLDVPDRVILERIEGRWVHKASGRTYNTGFNPPKRPGLDDITGEPLSKRADDNVETFRKRLETFHKNTKPMLRYYAAQDQLRCPSLAKLITVTGETSKIIWPQIKRVCDERFSQLRRTAGDEIIQSKPPGLEKQLSAV